MGSTDFLECKIQLTWRSAAAAGLDLQQSSEEGTGGGGGLRSRGRARHAVQYSSTP